VQIHYVIQPVTGTQMAAFGAYGPKLQVGMVSAGELPETKDIEVTDARARLLFAGRAVRRTHPAIGCTASTGDDLASSTVSLVNLWHGVLSFAVEAPTRADGPRSGEPVSPSSCAVATGAPELGRGRSRAAIRSARPGCWPDRLPHRPGNPGMIEEHECSRVNCVTDLSHASVHVAEPPRSSTGHYDEE
jgi:hypothetical protein